MNGAYETILEELEGESQDIARKLIELLKANPQGMNRRQLVLAVHGVPARIDLNKDNNDRKNRLVIAALRLRCIPIVSTSGKAGYRLDESDESRKKMLGEMISRSQKLNAQIKAASIAWHIPVEPVEMLEPVQGRLL